MAKRRRIRPASALDSVSPIRVSSQIASLQLIYYFAACVLILFSTLVAGTTFSLDLIFSWRSLRGDNTVGWMLGLVWILNCLVSVIAITILIGRTKFVLDFSLTLHFIHLVITSFYTHSIPASWLWWALQLFSSVLMVLLATWTCQWKEMRPISWKGGGSSVGGSTSTNPSSRHLNESGADYEMMRLKEEDV